MLGSVLILTIDFRFGSAVSLCCFPGGGAGADLKGKMNQNFLLHLVGSFIRLFWSNELMSASIEDDKSVEFFLYLTGSSMPGLTEALRGGSKRIS
jgi:hypothetical protein